MEAIAAMVKGNCWIAVISMWHVKRGKESHMKAMPATVRGTKQCQRRSSNRLELHPKPIIAMTVGTYRIAVIRATLALCHACNGQYTALYLR